MSKLTSRPALTFGTFPLTKSRDYCDRAPASLQPGGRSNTTRAPGLQIKMWMPYYVRKADGLAHFDLCISALPHRKLANSLKQLIIEQWTHCSSYMFEPTSYYRLFNSYLFLTAPLWNLGGLLAFYSPLQVTGAYNHGKRNHHTCSSLHQLHQV